MKINRLNNQSKIKINLTQKLLHYRKKQFEGHSTTKRNSRNEEYKMAKGHIENPDD